MADCLFCGEPLVTGKVYLVLQGELTPANGIKGRFVAKQIEGTICPDCYAKAIEGDGDGDVCVDIGIDPATGYIADVSGKRFDVA